MSRRSTPPRTTPSSSTRPGAAAAAGSSTRRRTPRRCPGRSAAALKAPRAALKIAPGIPHEAIPAEAEAEWISDGGDVKEAVLWFGDRARRLVRATLLPRAARPCAAPARCPTPPVGPVGRYLYEPDGAVIRAHLVAEVAGAVGRRADRRDDRLRHARRAVRSTPYATAYEITDRLPFSVKKLKALLREREVGRPDREEARARRSSRRSCARR